MISATLSEFRNNQSEYIAAAQRQPVELISGGANRLGVLVSPEFFDRAFEALEDRLDLEAVAEARECGGYIPFDELVDERGL